MKNLTLTIIIIASAFTFTFGQSAPIDPKRGSAKGSSTSISDIENINLTNGNLMLNMPLVSLPPSRGGLSASYGMVYNSKLFKPQVEEIEVSLQLTDQNLLYPSDEGGWRPTNSLDFRLKVVDRFDGVSSIDCNSSNNQHYWKNAYKWKLQVTMPDGSDKDFRPAGYTTYSGLGYDDGFFNFSPGGKSRTAVGYPTCSVTETTVTTGPIAYYSADGSHIRLVLDPTNYTFSMYFPDGSYYQSSNGRLTDRYGNYVQKTGSFTYDGKTAYGIEDNVGRKVFYTPGDEENVYYQLGFDGAEVKWVVKKKNIFVRRQYQTTANTDHRQRGGSSTQTIDAYFEVVDEIIQPDQLGEQQKFTFEYSGSDTELTGSQYSAGYGEVVSVEMPSGAIAEYEYVNTIENTDRILAQGVTKKTLKYEAEYDNSTTPIEDVWTYSYNFTTYTSTTVTSPDGSSMVQHHYSTKSEIPFNGHVRQVSSSNGPKVEKIWASNATPWGGLNSFVKEEYTSIKDANGNYTLTAIKTFAQDKNGSSTLVKEYDFVPYANVPRDGSGFPTGLPGGLTEFRSSHTTYNNSTPDSSDVTTNATYAYWNHSAIKGVAASTEIRNSSNQTVSKSEMTYDNYATTANPTLSRTWDSSKGSISNPLIDDNSVKSQATYNSFGAPLTTTDPNGVVTTITYGCIDGNSSCAANLQNLYPTKTEAASNYSTLKRTATAKYDYYSGATIESKDVDNNVSVVTEYDDLGRPVRVRNAYDTALESWTQTTYHDGDVSDPRRYIVVRSDLEAKGDYKKVATQFFDQLGRVRLAKTLEDASYQSATNETDGIKVQTRYLTSGTYSYQLSSNPYRANYSSNESATTMGWTRSKSWNTGIKQEVETFNGASLPAPWGSNSDTTGKVVTDIDANATTVTDQASKLRRSITNGLGQLVRVDEPSGTSGLGAVGSPNQPTSYAYDPLNNLTTVTQGVQTRTFTYDALSRLKSAANPESGTINYVYDNNGNLTSKIDARQIQTTYTYDALNRVLTRRYSGNSAPAVDYAYDGVYWNSAGQPQTASGAVKGKLTAVWTNHSATSYTSFDQMGRVTSSSQITDATTYPMTYTYNLSGGLIEQTYPSGRVVKNVLDNTGDLSLVQSKKNANSGFWTYANSFTYNAAGAVTSMQLGNGKWESTAFNSRLQPTQIALGTVQNGTDKLRLDYTYGTTNNNGNVLTQNITVPTVGSYTGFTATQTYAYDALNRLDDANETINSIQTWRQDYTFDRYGNRNFNTTNTTTLGSCPTEVCNPTISATNNRLTSTGWLYDNAGNTSRDGNYETFTYDGENKQTEVRNSANAVIGQYSYDGDGKRVKKHVPSTGETTIFVYDAAGKQIAEYSTIVADASTAKVAYLTADHLGSPRINTDATGAVTSRHDYHPFGEELATSQRTTTLRYADDTVRNQFTGYQRDRETDLDFAQARMYAKRLGRFMTADPLMASATRGMPQTWNRYAYVTNCPLVCTDPTGMFMEWVKDKDGAPLWVPHDEYVAKQTERSNFALWTDSHQLKYESTDGDVELDPAGPSEALPQGWKLDGIPVGDPSEPGLQPAPAGQNTPESTATDTPPLGMTSGGDPRRNWLFMYLDAHARRSRAQSLFPDRRGLDAERHRWATRQTALRWGTGTARTFGVLNEVQGFIFHDLEPLIHDAARSYPSGIFVSTRRQWAFQWSDLQHNERGINEANTILNQPKNNIPK